MRNRQEPVKLVTRKQNEQVILPLKQRDYSEKILRTS